MPPPPMPRPRHPKLWLHEVKHDGFRVIARKAGERVKLYSRPGNDLTWRFPLDDDFRREFLGKKQGHET